MADPTEAQKQQLAELTLGQGDLQAMKELIELAAKTGVTAIFIDDVHGKLDDPNNVAIHTEAE